MNELNKIIAREIQTGRGAISFARFMELALYTPELGYYEQPCHAPGRQGDFYTSVSVGCVFGELLACQFATWLDAWRARLPTVTAGRWILLETGAHDGGLALDILNWLRQWRPDLLMQITYGILEPSASRRAWQQERLATAYPNVQWWDSWAKVPAPVNGILFSNELLDAFPVHQFRWQAESRQWQEMGVALASEFCFKETPIPLDPALAACLPEIPPELQAVLPEGYQIEISPTAVEWWQTAAQALENGVLMTIDYGYTEDQWLVPGRQKGTLRTYARHHATDNLLAEPGTQDLTAHVNFTHLIRAGEKYGLTTPPLSSQADFLTRIVQQIETVKTPFPAWTPPRLRQLQTLIHPAHLGHPFSILTQMKVQGSRIGA